MSWARAFSVLIFTSAALLTGCESYLPCHAHFGSRILPGERVEDGIPNLLTRACMFGAETVGPTIMRAGTPEAECEKKYGRDKPAESISNSLEQMDACAAGAKGFVRFIFHIHGSKDMKRIQYCEEIRGKLGMNPELACY